MQKVITTLKDILTPLCKRKNVPTNDDWEHVFSEWPPLAPTDIDRLIGQAKIESKTSETVELDFSQGQRGRLLYLPPLEKDPGCIPILSLYCKLKEPQSIAKFRVLLVRLDKEREPDGIYGIGFRMETPEKINQNASPSTNNQDTNTTNNSGRHDFHHAQLIRKFGQDELDNKLQIDCPIWLPQSQPSFPLPAECPVTLLLCLLVTLYGGKYYNDFIEKHTIFEIDEYTPELNRWINQ